MKKNLAVLALVAVGAVSQANLIVNGSFEMPVEDPWAYLGSIPGWTADGQNVLEIGQGGTYGVTGFVGDQVMELDSTANVVATQSLNLSAGIYRLTYSFARRGEGMSGKPADTADFEVLWNGSSVAGHAPISTAMTSNSMVLNVASDGLVDLSFRGLGTSDSYGALIDDVQLEAVPEPATLAILGLGALGVARRRNRKA